ncbi:MAG: ExeM/NucH family extracellular endonuclease [Hyphomicrobiaceae bacterium]
MSNVYHSLASGSLTQNWADPSLITVNDDWSGVPSIVGYLGSDVTAATAADPQTLLTDGTVAIDVIANQTTPNTNTSGGVAEFAITDPVVALQGSGTADAPSLVLHLDATGRQDVRVRFNARDIDASADNALQQIAVQYRLGETGTWTNVPAGFITDASTGPSLATLVTPVDVTLPATVNNQAQVQVRIITANATGSDEWIGIDDINVSSAAVVGAAATVSIGDVTITEGDSGTSIATFTVTRSDNTGAFTLTYATADGSATAGSDYVSATGTLTFTAGGPLTQTVSVTINGDMTAEASETFTVALSNLVSTVGTATIADGSGLGTIQNDDIVITRIHDVQGAGAASTLVGQTVTVEAIVVGDFQNGDADAKRNLNGFYLQELAANADANAATSEGIFIFMGALSSDVNVGDRVRVTGVVSEFFGQTQVAATSVSVVQAGAVADVSTMAATVNLPAAGVTLSQDNDYQPDLEAYEGMLVTIPQTLTITEQFNLDRFNEIKLVAGDRPAQFTHDNAPDAAGYAAHLQALGARTITYDDGLVTQNAAIGTLDGFGPTYNTANAPRMGDTVTNLTGVLDYQWAGAAASGSTWRVRAIVDGDNVFADSTSPREATPDNVGGRLQVGSFNVLNFFKTLNSNPSDDTTNSDPSDNIANGMDSRGANNATEFTRQVTKLVNVLAEMDADILGLIELENDFLNNAPGNAIDFLVDQLNAVVGAGTYAWIDPGQQHVGGDAISVGYIYQTAMVRVAPGTSVQILNDADLPALGLSSLLTQSTVGHVFDGSNTSRNVVAVTWQEISSGETITTAANHFKSKSGTGTGVDADQLDGAGNWNNQRLLAATALEAWLDTNPTGTTDQDYLILGDLNAYFQEDPIEYLISHGYINLQETMLANPYSYVFDGQLGALDYILANTSLLGEITGITEWHINADEADALDYNTDFTRDPTIFDANTLVRVSDHDPLLIGLNLSDQGPAPMPVIYNGSATATNAITLTPISTITLAGAEISAYDSGSKRFFVTSSTGLSIVDATNPAAPTLVVKFDFVAAGAISNDVQSVAVKNGIVAVALRNLDKTAPGEVVFLNAATGTFISKIAVGANPDMVTFTPDGTKVLVANEAELRSDVSVGPADTDGVVDSNVDAPGTVSIISIAGGAASPTVQTAGFTAFDGQEAALRTAGVRIFPGKTVSQDVEPEYIAISPDGTKAFITLQEANAIAILDIATATITDIEPLGKKDFTALQADFSDRDSATNGIATELKTGAPVFGLYMPDAIASFTAGGQTYYVIANEGDDRDDFVAPDETIRVNSASYDLDNTTFANEGTAGTASVAGTGLKGNDSIGRLTVSNLGAGSSDANITQLRGDTDADGDIDQILAYGGRSFSILDSAGNIVFDSGDIIERVTSVTTGAFDDTRSDNKAAEPEGITVGNVGGRTYAFVALERANAVMTFDITDPVNVSFTNFAAKTGDVSPEGIAFIDAAASPNGQNLVAVSNEVSGTLTLYQVDQPFTLQILHYYGESGLLGVDTAPIMGAMIDKFDDAYTNTLVLGEGDSFIPGPWLVAGADPSLNAVPGIGTTALARPDIAIMNAFGTDASALGNHEFDLGSPVLQGAIAPSGAWVGAQFPLITSNLNFAGDSSLRGLADASLGGTATNAFAGLEASAIKAKIAPYAVVTQGGEKIGLVGSTTWELLSKSSPNGTVPKDDANPATSDLQEVAAYLQASVDALKALGVNKIVMVDQLDTLQRNKDLAGLVSGIDIMVAGGGHELMKDATDTLGSYPGHVNPAADAYPILTAGLDGKPVLIVTTDTEYSYLGRLVVEFNGAGELNTAKLNPAINGAYSSDAATLQAVYGTADTAATIIGSSVIGSKVQAIVTAIDTVVASKDGNIFGYTNVYLEGDRVFGRTQEVNLGDISADANLDAASEALPAQDFMVSLKNGGGLRASIGSIDANGNKIPPIASDVKPAGAISQLDIENALRFDNKLMVFDTTPQGLLAIFNYAAGLSSGATVQNGGYPQVGGIRFSYNSANPTGAKIENISLVDEAGNIIARIVENGIVVPDAPATISVVTLNFTANGGDGYPIKANGDNFRYLLTDGTLSAAVSEALDFTAVANVPANALGEQKAFQDYLLENHATPATAYNGADTPVTQDQRIQILSQGKSDTVLDSTAPITGDAGNNTLPGTAGDDVQNGGDGADFITGSRGDDVMDGGAGTNDTADFSASGTGLNVNLAAGQATTTIGAPTGFFTKSAAMLEGENGYQVVPLLTIGDKVTGTTGALNVTSAGSYQPIGVLDGIGAYSLNATTVRVFVNHEVANNRGQAYTLESGVSLTGARVSYVDINKATKAVVDAGIGYGDIYDRAGNLVTSASQLDVPAGLDRLCSASLYEANQFGAGKGIADRIYFTGEESSSAFGHPYGGTMWALDTATGNLWAVPKMGRGGWENVTQVDTGTTTHVAFLVSDDTNGSPMYLYVGQKNAAGDFLDRNGLKTGQLYVWKADTAGVNSPAELASGTATGTWAAIDVLATPAEIAAGGADPLGYRKDATLTKAADALGAFSFSRPEDVSTNPANGTQVVFASTGASLSTAQTADGVADPSDTAGTIYKIDLNFTTLAAPTGSVSVLYNSNADATKAIRNPDNLDWADDGFVYVQEDRSLAALFTSPTAANPNDASIVKIDPATGAIVARVAAIDRGAVPYGQIDTAPTDKGNWESSGILDVSTLFGEAPGRLFLTDVQAHSITFGNAATSPLSEGGQLALIAAPGVDVSPVIEIDTVKNIENVIGSQLADQVVGDGANNAIYAGGGNDTVSAGAGDDVVSGGDGADGLNGDAGNDIMAGGLGADWLTGGTGNDGLSGDQDNDVLFGNAGADWLTGGTGNDYLDGGTEADVLFGNEGADGIFGGTGDDYIDGGADNDSLLGQDGNDGIFGGLGNDSIDGGAGGDTLFGDEGDDYILGGDGSDIVNGGTGADQIFGGAGADQVIGGDGNDGLNGDAGDDVLDGGLGDDWLNGGDGADGISGGDGSDVLYGNAGADWLTGGLGSDFLDGGDDNDVLFGNEGADGIFGGLGSDYIDGGDANDQLLGDGGNDGILGGLGDDELFGGAGSDTLIGGAGNDRLLGGADGDIFTFGNGWGLDRIDDFENGVDSLDLAGVTGLDAFSQLAVTQVGADVEIAFGGNKITIANTSATLITQDDVII